MQLIRGGSSQRPAVPKALKVVVCAAPLLLGGCASLFDPYIDVERPNSFDPVNDPMPMLQKAATSAEATRQKAAQNRTDYTVTRSVLNYGTFGAAAAGGIAALYGAHRDLVLGLGVGAATGYSGSTLFASTDIVTTYLDASKALGCVVGRADTAIAAGKSLSELTAPGIGANTKKGAYAAKADELNDLRNDPTLDWSGSQLKAVVDAADAADAGYRGAVQNVAVFMDHDGDFATAVSRTVTAITAVMNDRINKALPDISAVLRAGEGIGKLGLAFVDSQSAGKPKSTSGTSVTTRSLSPRTPGDPAKLAALTTEVKQITDKINQTLTGATNGIGEVGTICVLPDATPTALSADQTEINVSKDQTVTVTLKGGKLPLTRTWQGTDPSASGLDAALFDRTVVFTGRSGLKPGTSYTLLVRDSLAAASEVKIKVTTK